MENRETGASANLSGRTAKPTVHPLPAAQIVILPCPGRSITGFGFQWGNDLFTANIQNGADRPVVANALTALAREISRGPGVASDNWYSRLLNERDELRGRYDKIVAFINDGYPGVETTEDHALINQQALAMREYLLVLDQRVAAARPDDVAAPVGEAREIGGHDPVRDGPIPFDA